MSSSRSKSESGSSSGSSLSSNLPPGCPKERQGFCKTVSSYSRVPHKSTCKESEVKPRVSKQHSWVNKVIESQKFASPRVERATTTATSTTSTSVSEDDVNYVEENVLSGRMKLDSGPFIDFLLYFLRDCPEVSKYAIRFQDIDLAYAAHLDSLKLFNWHYMRRHGSSFMSINDEGHLVVSSSLVLDSVLAFIDISVPVLFSQMQCSISGTISKIIIDFKLAFKRDKVVLSIFKVRDSGSMTVHDITGMWYLSSYLRTSCDSVCNWLKNYMSDIIEKVAAQRIRKVLRKYSDVLRKNVGSVAMVNALKAAHGDK